MPVKPITSQLRQAEGGGLFHDSRKDVRTLIKANNILVAKVNELVREVNKLQEKPNAKYPQY